MQTQVSAQEVGHLDSEKTKGECEQSFSTTLDVGGLPLVLGLALRPMWYAFVGSSTIIDSLKRGGARMYRPTCHRRAFALGLGALAGYVTQLIFRRGSKRTRTSLPRSRWILIFPIYCVEAPWRHWVDNWIFRRMRWSCTHEGLRFPGEGTRRGAVSCVRSISKSTHRGTCAALWFRLRNLNGPSRTSARTCPTQDFICPTHRADCTSLTPRERFRPVWQAP